MNNDDFGNWLSGFTDGEGYFGSNYRHIKSKISNKSIYKFDAAFQIQLRDDDKDIIKRIKDHLNCGKIYYYREYKYKSISKPAVRFEVHNYTELHNIIIPFFERYQLRSKKRYVFDYWKLFVDELFHTHYKHRKQETVRLLIELHKKIIDIRKYESNKIKEVLKNGEEKIS